MNILHFIPRTFLLMFACSFLALSCTDDTDPVNPGTLTGTQLFSGDFVSAEHTTIGKVNVIKAADGTINLQMVNFKTDSGPDLRIYASEDITASKFVELRNKALDGSYYFTVDPSVDFKKNKHILIWCKSFKVLFGRAELQ
jgi:hypothetical protein